MTTGSLRKTSLDCIAGKRLNKNLYLKEAEKEFVSTSFCKVNALRKGRSGAYSQEEIFLKCSRVEAIPFTSCVLP